jgi:hypothetical protein
MSPGNKARILELVHSIQADAREVRMLVETEESNFEREWPFQKNFVGDDCWQWLCGDEDDGSIVKSANALFAAIDDAGPKATDNE